MNDINLMKLYSLHRKEYLKVIKSEINEFIKYPLPKYDVYWYKKEYNINFIDAHFDYFYFKEENSLYLNINNFFKQMNYIFNTMIYRVLDDNECDKLTKTIYLTFKTHPKFESYLKKFPMSGTDSEKMEWSLNNIFFEINDIENLFKSVGFEINDNFITISKNINFNSVIENWEKRFQNKILNDENMSIENEIFEKLSNSNFKYSFISEENVFNKSNLTLIDNTGKLIFVPQTLLFYKG
jgi:hypothetical protein